MQILLFLTSVIMLFQIIHLDKLVDLVIKFSKQLKKIIIYIKPTVEQLNRSIRLLYWCISHSVKFFSIVNNQVIYNSYKIIFLQSSTKVLILRPVLSIDNEMTEYYIFIYSMVKSQVRLNIVYSLVKLLFSLTILNFIIIKD